MRIFYNASAVFAQRTLGNTEDMLSKSTERLSSGFKINHAKDNPAGLAMANRMNAQLSRTNIAIQNASDGISVIETADGAMSEMSNILARMRELAVQSANGTLTEEDRAAVAAEVTELKEEISEMTRNTQFNGQPILNGDFEKKGYANVEGLSVSYYSDDVQKGSYEITSLTVRDEVDELGKPTGYMTAKATDLTLGNGFPKDAKVTNVADGILTIEGQDGFEMKLDINELVAGTTTGVALDITGIGAMRMQIGSEEGQILEMSIPKTSLRNMGIESLDISTQEFAQEGIDKLDTAISFVNKVRGQLGAYQNRMESTATSLGVTEENLTSAYARIMDVDMAEEMTQYTTYQVLSQAGTAVLAQANERPSSILQLLQ
jgi:flagellin